MVRHSLTDSTGTYGILPIKTALCLVLGLRGNFKKWSLASTNLQNSWLIVCSSVAKEQTVKPPQQSQFLLKHPGETEKNRFEGKLLSADQSLPTESTA